MTDRERRRKDRADRAMNFFTAKPNPEDPQSKPRRESFDPQSTTTKRLADLETLLGKDGQQGLIDEAHSRQQGGGGESDAKSVIADGLRSDLADLTRTARELEDTVPGIAAKFPAPENSGYAALRTAVLAHLQNLTPKIKAALVAEELPADFDDQLRSDLEDFDNADDEGDTALDTQVRGTESVGLLLGRADALVGKLNAAVRNKFKRDPETLRAWLVASKVERAPAARKKPAPASPAPPK
jgi:hypothetical protein